MAMQVTEAELVLYLFFSCGLPPNIALQPTALLGRFCTLKSDRKPSPSIKLIFCRAAAER